MNYWGMENVEFRKLSRFLFSQSLKGTANSSMVYFPELFGLKTYSFTGNFTLLEKLLERKIPVIVLQNYSSIIKIGHFRIVLGMDKKKQLIYLKDPAKRRILKKKYIQFRLLWERGNTINNNKWAMVMVPAFYEFALDEVTQSVLSNLNRGTYYYRKFDYINAYNEFKKAFDKKSKNKDVLKYYSQVLIRLKRYPEALKIIHNLLNLDPMDAIAYDLMGLVYFYQGNPDQALVYLEKAIKLNKNPRENRFISVHYNQVRKFVEGKKEK